MDNTDLQSQPVEQITSIPTEHSAEQATIPLLVACVGNIFLGDDGFGVEVARCLSGRTFPPGVVVEDFGIRGLDLAYTLLDGCDTLILVDATPRGGAPGTLYTLTPPTPEEMLANPAQAGASVPDGHSMNPVSVLGFAYRLGARPGRVVIIGCEPERPPSERDDTEMRIGLSEPVRAAVETAACLVESHIERFLAGNMRNESKADTGSS